MFAIRITNDNMPKILDRYMDPPLTEELFALQLNSPGTWYIVTGYVTRRGAVMDWAILPAYLIEGQFQYDHEKIQHDWDQIVRQP